MPTNYTPNDANNPTTITLPSDLDPLVAEAFNAAYRAIADKAGYAIATRAALALQNTFTRGQQVEPTAEDEHILYSTRYPGSITADNRWALVFRFRYESGRSIRMYTGGLQGIGRMAWTMNARWNVAEQQWELEDDSAEAAAILWADFGITVHHVTSGTSPFLHWPATSIGSEGSVRAVGEFRYASSKTRVRTIPLSTCAGAYTLNNAGNGSVGAAVPGTPSHIRWPIRLPPGGVLNKVDILHYINESATETFRLTRRRPTWDPGSLSVPSESYLFTVDSSSAVGTHITTLNTPGTAVDRYDDLNLVWIPSAITLNAVHGIRIEWSDQGPTPL